MARRTEIVIQTKRRLNGTLVMVTTIRSELEIRAFTSTYCVFPERLYRIPDPRDIRGRELWTYISVESILTLEAEGKQFKWRQLNSCSHAPTPRIRIPRGHAVIPGLPAQIRHDYRRI